MGLDISSASDKDYHYSYRGIHIIRHMAYQSMGGKMDFGSWMEDQRIESQAYLDARAKFPNLYWHSDCDGEYTIDGKVESFEGRSLQTGNSRELLEELEYIKENLKPVRQDDLLGSRDSYVFYMFYDLVKDVVENHDGKIEFH